MDLKHAKRVRMLTAIADDAPKYKRLFERVYAQKASPRVAIKAQCLHCVWFKREFIAECTALECPLWAYRPYQEKP